MAKPTSNAARPLRSLAFFFVLMITLFGTLLAGTYASDASWRPNLALDLEGGTQIILTPRTENADEISDEQIGQAIEIIRQRVDASGVAEAEISSQGGSNIVVGLPGEPSEETLNLVRQSAQMRFRAFLTQRLDPRPVDTTGEEESADLDDLDPEEGTDDENATDGGEGTSTEDGSEDGTEDDGEAPEEPATPPTREELEEAAFRFADQNNDGVLSDEPVSPPLNAADEAWVTEQVLYDFLVLDCTDPQNLIGGSGDDPERALAACAADGQSKYILGPMEIPGTDIQSATAGFRVTPGGVTTNEYQVSIQFNREGGEKFAEVTSRLAQLSQQQQFLPPDQRTNRFAMVLDGLVLTAPSVEEAIFGGQASVFGGNMTRESSQRLASQLNFGALPIEFVVQSEEQISATLGSEQLQRGLLAGLIGLGLVVIYALFQYRALAIISLASLALGGVLTYVVIALLSWTLGFRLSLAGVAGLIVAIGIIADSFIVYFERIRDEVREGRRLPDAVEQGWKRARRTILASDAVNIMGAVVLYFVAVGGVRGFAFTLGLITVIDLIVFIFFTHPFMKLLIRTRFFEEGSKISGLDPEHLGAVVSAYRGRGQIRSKAEREEITQTIAERRRAEAKAKAEADDEAASVTTSAPAGIAGEEDR